MEACNPLLDSLCGQFSKFLRSTDEIQKLTEVDLIGSARSNGALTSSEVKSQENLYGVSEQHVGRSLLLDT